MGSRVALVAALWFAFWMILSAALGGILTLPGISVSLGGLIMLRSRLPRQAALFG